VQQRDRRMAIAGGQNELALGLASDLRHVHRHIQGGGK